MEFYQTEKTNLLRRIVGWIVDIIVVVSIGWFAVYSFGTQVRMVGHSMLPVLKSEDVVLMNRLIYDFGSPQRFDVVVFQREDEKTNIKRVIGLPGESVQIKGGLIYIDGMPLEESHGLNEVSLAGLASEPVLLGEDEYFLLGDNREGSEDSRFANIGNVNRKQILGKVWLKALPVIEIELIE